MHAGPIGLLTLAAVAFATNAAAQSVIAGRVVSSTGEPMGAATVTLLRAGDSLALRVHGSDANGRFRFPGIDPGAYVVRAQRLGYRSSAHGLAVTRDTIIALELVLKEEPIPLPSLPVEAERARTRFESDVGLTTRELTRDELKLIPGLAEADVLRAIEVLPGVVATSDFSSAFNVRGGSADQNLILLDGIPIYNPFHLGGLFSVFNADMVERAELLAGGFPAQYGGRVSSVLNVHSDAAARGTSINSGVSVLATRVALGTNIPNELVGRLGLGSGRARVGIRRSYFDQLLKPLFDFPYHLTDIQVVLDAWTARGARLGITAYAGEDVLDFRGVNSFPLKLSWDWGNQVVGARWSQPLAQGGVLELKSSFSRFATSMMFPDFSDTRFRSRIEHSLLHARAELPRGAAVWSGGLELNRLGYANVVKSGGTVFRQGRDAAWHPAAYVQTTLQPSKTWLLEAGVRADGWASDGLNAFVPAPRFAAKHFLFNGTVAAKLALGRYSQFVHSVRDEELPLGLDVWILASERAPYVRSDQLQVGLEWLREQWSTSLEGYVRAFDGVTTNNFTDDPNLPNDDLIDGTGLSYGADFVLRKDRGTVRGFTTISMLRTWREFADVSSGEEQPGVVRYPPVFDRRLELELVLLLPLPWRWEGGVRWNYGSGLPYTRAIAAYSLFDYQILDGRKFENNQDLLGVLLAGRNAARYPNYHRLDVSMRKTFRKRWGSIAPHLDILNVYNRKNVLFYFYEYGRNPPVRSGVSMFPFLPTVGVEVSF